jgi:hypothetical protein
MYLSTGHLFRLVGPTLCLSACSALAAFGAPVTTLQGLKAVPARDANGKPVSQLVEFTKLLPGEEAHFVLTCANPDQQEAGNLVLTLPVPAEMTCVPASAESDLARVDYSVDGGAVFGALSTLRITEPTGAVRLARPSDVTTLRWTLHRPLPAGQSAVLRYRAILK